MNQHAKRNTSARIIALITSLLLFATANSALAMTDMSGKPVQLQSMTGNGKWTVAKIWAHDCHVCHKTIHYLTQFKQRFPEAEVFGISTDGQENKQSAQQFIKQFKLTFPNLLSDGTEVSDYLYSQVGETLVGTPTLVVYNPQGKIEAVQPGAVKPDTLIKFIQQKQAEAAAN